MHAFELLSRQVTKTGTNAPSLLVVLLADDGIDGVFAGGISLRNG